MLSFSRLYFSTLVFLYQLFVICKALMQEYVSDANKLAFAYRPSDKLQEHFWELMKAGKVAQSKFGLSEPTEWPPVALLTYLKMNLLSLCRLRRR